MVFMKYCTPNMVCYVTHVVAVYGCQCPLPILRHILYPMEILSDSREEEFTILDYMYHVLQWKFVLQITRLHKYSAAKSCHFNSQYIIIIVSVLHSADIIHVTSIPTLFATFPFPCVIVNTNQRKMGEQGHSHIVV